MTQKRGRWITNALRERAETHEEMGRVIGPPQPTPECQDVREMKKAGIVGVYEPEQKP